MNGLDIDRLHNVIDRMRDGKHIGRQEGKSEALLQLMLGEVFLGGPGNRYLYVGNTNMQAYTMCNAFLKKVIDEGYKVQRQDNTILVEQTGQVFKFENQERVTSNSFRGQYFAEIFSDLTDRPAPEILLLKRP